MIEVGRIERSPMGNILQGEIWRTTSKERQLTRWIEQLKFDIGNAETGNHTSERKQKNLLFLCSNMCVFTWWQWIVSMFVPSVEEENPLIGQLNHQLIGQIRSKWTTENSQRRFQWLWKTFVSPKCWSIHLTNEEKWRWTTLFLLYLFDWRNRNDWENSNEMNHPKGSMNLQSKGNSRLRRFDNNIRKSNPRRNQWTNRKRREDSFTLALNCFFIKIERVETRIQWKIFCFSSTDQRSARRNEIDNDSRAKDSNNSKRNNWKWSIASASGKICCNSTQLLNNLNSRLFFSGRFTSFNGRSSTCCCDRRCHRAGR